MADDHSLHYFGPAPWNEGMLLPELVIPTPAGEECCYCHEPIAATDSGVRQAALLTTGPAFVFKHRECFLRLVFGSVAHQEHRCKCYGGGDEDPPGLTRREAATAAMELGNRLAAARILARYRKTE